MYLTENLFQTTGNRYTYTLFLNKSSYQLGLKLIVLVIPYLITNVLQRLALRYRNRSPSWRPGPFLLMITFPLGPGSQYPDLCKGNLKNPLPTQNMFVNPTIKFNKTITKICNAKTICLPMRLIPFYRFSWSYTTFQIIHDFSDHTFKIIHDFSDTGTVNTFHDR